MNSKRSVYLLLPLVALVWGLIGWRIWAATGEPAVAADQLTPPALPKLARAAARPPRLLLTYDDPFKPVGGDRLAENSPPASAVSDSRPAFPAAPAPQLPFPVRPTIPPPTAAATVDWPQVKYLGVITHTSGQAQVVLLNIDNEEVVIKVGQRARDIQVLRLFRDSVQLGFKNQRRNFYRIAAY